MKIKKAEETVVIGVRVPVSLREGLERIALEESRTISGQTVHFLKKAIDDYDRAHPEGPSQKR